MNDKEYTYDIDKYTIGVDTNGEDGIGMTIAIIKNGEIHFLGNCYGENARCIDLLIKENQELKKQLTTYQMLHRNCKVDNLKNISKIEEMENQQKEFINYLTSYIDLLSNNPDLIEESEIDLLKEILSKYKSIIGGK